MSRASLTGARVDAGQQIGTHLICSKDQVPETLSKLEILYVEPNVVRQTIAGSIILVVDGEGGICEVIPVGLPCADVVSRLTLDRQEP